MILHIDTSTKILQQAEQTTFKSSYCWEVRRTYQKDKTTSKIQQVQSCHICAFINKQDHVNLPDLYFFKEHGLQDSLAPSSATAALLTVRQYTTLVFLGSHCAKLKHSELSQLKRVRVTEVILPDGGGDTDRRPGSGSVRGVAAGTHHCRMAQRSSARLDLY